MNIVHSGNLMMGQVRMDFCICVFEKIMHFPGISFIYKALKPLRIKVHED